MITHIVTAVVAFIGVWVLSGDVWKALFFALMGTAFFMLLEMVQSTRQKK